MTARADRRIALIVGGILAVIFTLCSAVNVAGWSVGAVERSAESTIAGPVDEILVEAGAGDVTIIPTTGDGVRIESSASGRLHVAPEAETEIDGTRLRVSGGCPEIGFGDCDASLVLYVPADAAVKVDAASGDITASGLTHGVDLRTSSGDVTVHGISGNVDLESASGDVEAVGLRTDLASAKSASGDVELAFLVPPRAVEAETASGDVSILLPPGPETYAVEAETHSGERQVQVNEADDAQRVLRALTSSGDVTIDYGG